MTNDGEFTSKGFDLDAAGAASDGDDVVYEIGGGATITSTSPKVEERSSPSGDNSDKPNDVEQDSSNTEGEVGTSKEEPKTLLEKAEDWKPDTSQRTLLQLISLTRSKIMPVLSKPLSRSLLVVGQISTESFRLMRQVGIQVPFLFSH